MANSEKSTAPRDTHPAARQDQGSAWPPDAISSEERELMSEILRALRSMRYGSVVLTVHDGRLVEIQKTERIRRGGFRAKV